MASPKPIWSYERQFFDLAEQAIREGQVTLDFDLAFEARAFRSRLYAWREALLSNPEFQPSLAFICPRLRFELSKTEVRIRYVPSIPRLNSRQRLPVLPSKVLPRPLGKSDPGKGEER